MEWTRTLRKRRKSSLGLPRSLELRFGFTETFESLLYVQRVTSSEPMRTKHSQFESGALPFDSGFMPGVLVYLKRLGILLVIAVTTFTIWLLILPDKSSQMVEALGILFGLATTGWSVIFAFQVWSAGRDRAARIETVLNPLDFMARTLPE